RAVATRCVQARERQRRARGGRGKVPALRDPAQLLVRPAGAVEGEIGRATGGRHAQLRNGRAQGMTSEVEVDAVGLTWNRAQRLLYLTWVIAVELEAAAPVRTLCAPPMHSDRPVRHGPGGNRRGTGRKGQPATRVGDLLKAP